MARIPLAYPFTVDGVAYDHLEFRRCTRKQLRQALVASTNEDEQELILFSWLAGVPRGAIEELDVVDLRTLQRTYAGYTVASQAKDTGELAYPIAVDGAEIRRIDLRRPKARDLLAANRDAGSDAQRADRLYAILGGVSEAAIGELDLSDWFALEERYVRFTQPSRGGEETAPAA
ncbi:hypothetical protein KL86APRO_40045 [uncultured Alphaproteobacteria bacterium]|uniref:Phage tail assembly protein n=1 Tax=uncultured Alphaproteobacteria bacterium TaxID=91750 RepID=A0A212KMT6_9PROT|nr:hypothetical protein KL86APRO_40045 [uncultured Alphaproteobacteria bacterium]